jgi:diguanylate cyclase (GGDEF)-like protein/PAS domain S-box-containing protein
VSTTTSSAKDDDAGIVAQGGVVKPASMNRPRFHRHQTALFHKQLRNELLMHLCMAAAVCAVFWDKVELQWVAAWSLLVLLTLGWRSLLVNDQRVARDSSRINLWGKNYLLVALLSGATWGSLGVFAMFQGDWTQQIFVLVTVMAVTLGAFTSMQSSPVTYAAFALPALSPSLYSFLSSSGLVNQVLGGSVALLGLIMYVSSQSFRSLLASSIKLSSYNSELIHSLISSRKSTEDAKRQIEQANHELQKQIYERRQAEERIRESKERMQAIIEGLQDTIFHVDKDGKIKWATPSIRQLLDYSAEEVTGKPVRTLFMNDEDYEHHQEALEQSFGGLQHYEIQLRRKDGEPVWVSENSLYRYNEVGSIEGYEATLRDISSLKQTKEALFLAQERAYVTLGSIGDGVIAVNLDGGIDYMNIVAEQGTGWGLEEAHGKRLNEVFRIVDEKTLKPVPDPVQLCLEEQKSIMLPGYLLLMHQFLNQRISIEVIASPIRNSGRQISGVVLVFHDVSELRSLAQMTYHANHDSLTGLINRREFEKRVNLALENTRSKDIRYALCYMDLDNFKVVNDTCGHVAGDELLKQLTQALRNELREGDTLSRIGGDEFGILFSGCSISSAERLAEKIRKLVEEFRFVWDDKSFRIGASIGLVPVNADSGTISDVLSAADSACYVAKENGRNRIHIYQPNDIAITEQQGQIQWVQRIQDVLDRDRFRLYFQTIVPIQDNPAEDGKLHGEVLIRMLDDDNSIIGPDSFIPAAERYSMMAEIDRWVVENTLAVLDRDPAYVQSRISACSINLSGQSLSDDRFMNSLVQLIDNTSVPPELLCFEITETAVISNLSNATKLIARLRGMGCKFALDDFGVGLSSFGYLKNLAVDYLKLDGCFIKNMVRDGIDHAMVQSINHVGQTMKIRTIAEFVENQETLEALREIGVDYAQGYGIAKPRPLEEVVYGKSESDIALLEPA